MRRWNLLKYLTALFPVIAYLLTQFSDPIKRQFVNNYDLRWAKVADRVERTQSVLVHNGGDKQLNEIHIEITLPLRIEAPISDIDSTSLNRDPRYSFVDAMANPDFLAQLPPNDLPAIAQIVDRHSTARNLYELDDAFGRILTAKLRAIKADAGAAPQGDDKVLDPHKYWLKICANGKSADRKCRRINALINSWETSRYRLLQEGARQWEATSGVRAVFESSRFSPDGRVFFILSLGPSESKHVRIRLGPSAVPNIASSVVAASMDQPLEVVGESDLRASVFLIYLKYHTLLSIVCFLGLFVLGPLAWWILRPIRLRQIYQIFNIALETNDQEIWELAYTRHKYLILDRFRGLRTTFRKNVAISPEELFDYVRVNLREQFAKKRQFYTDEEHLNLEICHYLKKLVVFA
jgi:hypothetical protein